MKCLCLVKNFCEDIKCKICNNKLKAVLCALVALAGVILGFVLFKVFSYTWWYNNRCAYADKIFAGGFSLLFNFLLGYAAFYIVSLLCGLSSKTRILALAVLFIGCLYCGANTAAVVAFWMVWGILYAVFAVLVQVAGFCICCFIICCNPTPCSSFAEIICDTKPALIILAASFVAKFVGFFVILKIITAVI